MQRRDLLKMIASVTGMAMIGIPGLVSGYGAITIPAAKNDFSAADIARLDEIAETILPRTTTPGAKDAGVGLFMAQFVSDCYAAGQQAIFRAGLTDLDARAGGRFVALAPNARTQLLETIAEEAKVQTGANNPHYFTMLKQLTIFGFFTSEVGATQVLRYVAVPGYCEEVDYVPGTPAWATT